MNQEADYVTLKVKVLIYKLEYLIVDTYQMNLDNSSIDETKKV